MSLTVDIYDAFCAQVEAFAAAQDLMVAYPNIHSNAAHESGVIKPWGEMVAGIDPWGGIPEADMWLTVLAFWNRSQNYGLGNDGPTIERGIFRIVVVSIAGIGIVKPQVIAENALQHFKKGALLGPARIDQAPDFEGGPLQYGDRCLCPVNIRWRATR